MKFAYLVLAHKNPAQLARLCEALTSNGGIVFVHIDQKINIADFAAALANQPGVHLAERRWPIYWGGFNMINATLQLSAQALTAQADRLVLLSGLDLPIKPMADIEAVLGQNTDHLETSRLPNMGLGDDGGFHRIWYVHAMDWMGRLGLKPRTLLILHKLLPAFARRQPPTDLDIRMGSQWWCLRASTVRQIQAFIAQRPDVMRFFRYMGIPDEAFYQTLVHKLVPNQITPAHHRLIVWDRHPKPYVFQAQDFDELKTSPALFARKFDDTVNTEIIDRVLTQLSPACMNPSAKIPA